MRCAKCNNDNPADAVFCEGCGAKLELVCPTCKTLASPGARFCKKCGTALAAPSDSHLAIPSESPIRVTADVGSASEAIDGERKTVTALFADIKGSTELMEDLDPEEARAIIDPALKLMMDAVHRYDGYVVQSTGDGIFALFGAPVAHEDHPQRALYASLRMQEELRRYSTKVVADGGIPIEARVGVNTGEVVVRSITTGAGQVEYTPIGHTTNLASRMQVVAPTGSIAVSENTRKLCEGYFIHKPLGPTRVKGVSEPVNVFEVTGLGPLRTRLQRSAGRGLTKFVGRERELEQMQRALERAMSGQGQIVAAMAEAGTGKSRLFYEYKATIPVECKVLEAYSVSHGKGSPWLPVLELLRGYFGIHDPADAASRREKVRAALSALDPALDDTLPYLFGLLGIVEDIDPIAQMYPQIKRQRTLEAIKRVVLNESLKQPVVVIFEDLHWIDAQSQALLDLLADSLARASVLLLVNYRPEYRHEWTNKSYYSQLRLDPLSSADGAAMLAALLGESVELNPLKRLITERTGGNPFFIEEIVQALFDEGALVRNGAVKVTRSLAQLRLPPTVQGILASRIDRQPGEHKQLLQTLAVIGRESSLGLLRRVAPADTQLDRMLADLQAGEFIYEQPAATDVEYVFKHALTQEVAYNSLLIGRRKLIHERTAQAIETLFASSLVDHYRELAHHYSHTNNAEKAIEYLRLTGQQAAERSANLEAIANFKAALAVLMTLPETAKRTAQELALQVALGPSLQATKGWAALDVEQAYSRALELCQRIEETPPVFSALFGLQALYAHRPKLQAARELAERGLDLAQREQDPALLLEACHMLGYSLLYLGELALAREYSERGIALYDRKYHFLAFRYGGDDPAVCCLSHRAHALWSLGYPDQAMKSVQDALTLARGLSHPLSLALALIFAAVLCQFRRERAILRELIEEAMTVSTDQGFPYFSAWGNILHGWALADQGQKEGIAVLHRGLAEYQGTGAGSFRPYHLALLADAYQAAGQANEGRAALTEALACASSNGERFYEAELHRLKGELLLRPENSNAVEARSYFDRATAIARKQCAKSYELRATMSLARLLATQGKRAEARAMLAQIYNWFTEGFDTADLKDAKALLDRLDSES